MNINELERLTGITKQNIRFYEKKDCCTPQEIPRIIIVNIQRKTLFV